MIRIFKKKQTPDSSEGASCSALPLRERERERERERVRERARERERERVGESTICMFII